jgi:hypothetical protein
LGHQVKCSISGILLEFFGDGRNAASLVFCIFGVSNRLKLRRCSTILANLYESPFSGEPIFVNATSATPPVDKCHSFSARSNSFHHLVERSGGSFALRGCVAWSGVPLQCLDVRFEFPPTRKSVFPSQGELRAGKGRGLALIAQGSYLLFG